MNLFDIILIAIGLSMDCFAVSIACGITMKKLNFKPIFRMAFMFGLFQAIMPLLGWLAGSTFQHLIDGFDHWLAFGILLFLGGRMIYEYFFVHPENKKMNPYKLRVILILSIATSIDALAVGLSFAFLKIDLWFSVIIIGLTAFLFSVIGLLFGHRYGKRFKIPAELFGGIVLMGIGTKILLEHLCF